MKQKFDYRHILVWLLLGASLAATAFLYRFSVSRLIDGFVDLGYSLRYYFTFLFTSERPEVTVTQIPAFDLSQFVPFSVEELERKFTEMWGIVFKGETVLAYLEMLVKGLRTLTMFLLFSVPIVAILVPIVSSWLVKPTHYYVGEQRPSVKRFRKWVEDPARAVFNWIAAFYRFIRERPYFGLLVTVWVVNLNIATIVVEFFAFYFYFVMSLDFAGLILQLVKLLIDLIVMFCGAPLLFWLVTFAVLADRWRREIGYSCLDRFQRKNDEFMEKQPLVIMLTGTMGSRKTTDLSCVARSEQIRFYEKALDMISDMKAEYPNFPFPILERQIRWAVKDHYIYSLFTCREFVKKKKQRFMKDPCSEKLYGYDLDTYALEYNDSLTIRSLFDMIEDFTCVYFIYIMQSSLIVSNYSVRSDDVLIDNGHFPLWDHELFRNDPKEIRKRSRYSHILDFDVLRLGRKLIKDNPLSGSFEFGVIDISEIGKERGNNLTLQEMKRNTEETNQKNDLFNYSLKMIRHNATIRGFPFVRVLTDDQRPESWGADARDLCSILHIRESGDFKCMMPMFFLEDLIHDLTYPAFDRWKTQSYLANRSDVTLPYYILNNVMTALHRYRQRVHNLYGVAISDIEVERGTMDGETETHQFYVIKKLAYSDLFSTDCYREYFAERAKQTKVGLADYPEYAGVRATLDELHLQNSYFIGDMERLSKPPKDEPPKEESKQKKPRGA